VNLRAIHRSGVRVAPDQRTERPRGANALKGKRRILTGDGDWVVAGVYDRSALAADAHVAGPAIVEQADTTTLVEPGWHGVVAANGTLLIARG
jgi:N-methylhydantoinase A